MLELLLLENDRWVVILRVVSSFLSLSFKAAVVVVVVVVVKKMAYCHYFFYYFNVGFDWISFIFCFRGVLLRLLTDAIVVGVLYHVHSTRGGYFWLDDT